MNLFKNIPPELFRKNLNQKPIMVFGTLHKAEKLNMVPM